MDGWFPLPYAFTSQCITNDKVTKNMIVKLKLLSETAKVPMRAHPTDAGADLFYDGRDMVLEPGQRCLYGTGVSIAIEEDGYYARIAPRSGLAYKKGIDVLAGVIDKSYRGEIKVLLINVGSEPVEIREGEKIAQLIIERCDYSEFKVVDTLDDSDRGETGFGHSGNGLDNQ